ncbi:gamma-glutamylcyclotransferase family protein [Paenibacillus sp. FSL W8-1187]|nr:MULTISPECIES: gamma-glutamylcyclotransferase family protein [Paenibacillus]QGG55475.1 gamma-glutamylcyclotransferase [Paenibacillus sp. B01]
MSPSSGIWMFVYGTLQPGRSNFGVVAPFVLAQRPGRVRGRLVDAADGHYPALVRELSALNRAVRGWWLLLERDGLAACDRLEEFFGPEEANDYERIWTRDLDDPARQGWVYVWPDDRGCADLHNGVWP